MHKPSRNTTLLAVLAVALVAGPPTARGHIPQAGVGTACRIVVHRDRLRLTFDLSYAGLWAQAEMIAADTNRTSNVEIEEAEAYLETKWRTQVAPRLKVIVDGAPAAIRRIESRQDNLDGEIYGVPFSLYYELEVDAPDGGFALGREHTLSIVDTVTKGEVKAVPMYFVPYEGHGDGRLRLRPTFPEPLVPILDAADYLIRAERLDMIFVLDSLQGDPLAAELGVSTGDGPATDSASAEAGTVPPPATASETSVEPPEAAAPDDDHDENRLAEALATDQLGPLAVILLLLFAFLWGAGHALTPGHGKTMVAAYLVGTRGRVRDAVILGVTTTVAHTGSVFLLGLGIYLALNAAAVAASQEALQARVIASTQLVAAVALLLMGLIIFWRRTRPQAPGEAHAHDHGHTHAHSHGGDDRQPEEPDASGAEGRARAGAPRLGELIALGFTGGMVPCAEGLAVILTGMQQAPERLGFALLMLVAFSVGLGAVLVAIGVALVLGQALARASAKDGRFFADLQFLRRVFSAPFLAGLDRLTVRVAHTAPALSGLFVAGLGAYFLVSTLRTSGEEIGAVLRLLAGS